ncbi:MAG TPA: sialidase family protein, partial [Planctomycetaceae bacterium]|nr:sialidase family protein [Planctomycetaceae bacterium]
MNPPSTCVHIPRVRVNSESCYRVPAVNLKKTLPDCRTSVGVVLLFAATLAADLVYCSSTNAAEIARADEIRTRRPYQAKVVPGYCCWVCLWRDSGEGVYLSFVEKRRAPNPDWEPVPLDFWESMGLPHGYHTALSSGAKDIVYEIVVLKSVDHAETWVEIGRNRSRVDNSFSWAALSDGSLLRSQSNDYIAWHKGDRQQTWCETSADGGTTWSKRSVIFYGHNGS